MNLDAFRNVRPHDRPLVKRVIRRSLVGCVLVALGVALFLFWDSFAALGQPVVAVHPAPTHVLWHEFPVGGLFIAQFVVGDSTKVTLLPIPAGSILLVPQVTRGEEPDSTRDES